MKPIQIYVDKNEGKLRVHIYNGSCPDIYISENILCSILGQMFVELNTYYTIDEIQENKLLAFRNV